MINTIEDAEKLMEMLKANNHKLTIFNETGFTTKYLYRADKERFMRVKDLSNTDQEKGKLTAEMLLDDADVVNKHFEDPSNLKDLADCCKE